MLRSKWRLFLWGAIVLALLGVLALAGSYRVVRQSTSGRVYDEAAQAPLHDMGLVLGTSTFTRGHVHNPLFDGRMTAAALLFHSGRVRRLLLSGDNGSRGYDEPTDMKAALLALGVSAEVVTLDDAGFRTFDSVVGARILFGQQRLTIINDLFHSYRAVLLAWHQGIDAVAFPSDEVDRRHSFRSQVRESLADVKACLDLWILHTQPRLLGDPVPVLVAGR